MANTGPFYFALVDPTDKTFDPTRHNRWDLEILEFERTLEEGQMPKLDLRIQNPYRGLLNGQVWSWFSYHDVTTDTWYPIFFGRFVGPPKELDGTTLTVEIIGWPIDYQQQRQRVFDASKVDPFWDDVCISPQDRLSPDFGLEARTQLYDVSCPGLVVSLSDIIQAEDGNVSFTADQVFYKSLSQTVEDPPLASIQCEMNTSWTQRWRGYVALPDMTMMSYAGDGAYNDWPKPLTSLGGGYTVAYGASSDIYGISTSITVTISDTWNNPEKKHSNGDPLTVTVSNTIPILSGPYQQYDTRVELDSGLVDPYAVDSNGDPAPISRPMSSQVDSIVVPLWQVRGSLTVLVEAQRQRTERLVMTLNGNFQPVLVDPTIQQDTEVIKIDLADVGVPLVNLRDFTSIAGTFVGEGTVVFPDYPSVPGGSTAQIVTTPGVAAPFDQEPEWSNVPGVITTDVNGVQYTSLGNTNPTDGNQDWQSNLQVATGTIILPREPLTVSWQLLTRPGRLAFPQQSTTVQVGITIQGSNGSYWRCTISGSTNIANAEPLWTSTWGDTIIDGSVTWRCLGMSLPTGNDYFMALNTGITGPQYLTPPFDHSAIDAQTVDGTVTWAYIATADIPAGGTAQNCTAAWYFPTDRGQRSQRYGIARMRARMLARARCVVTKFQVSFIDGINLTTRMSSTITDPYNRIPGGQVTGKNTLIKLSGKHGAYRTDVTIKSCVGYEQTITPAAGSGVYAQDGVLADGVQQMTGQVIVLPTLDDVGYSPCVGITVDDGVSFPVRDSSSLVISDTIRGSLADQEAGIYAAWQAAYNAVLYPFVHPASNLTQYIAQQEAIMALGAITVGRELGAAPIWRDLQLKPMDSGPYGSYYNPTLTDQQGPQQINLQAGS